MVKTFSLTLLVEKELHLFKRESTRALAYLSLLGMGHRGRAWHLREVSAEIRSLALRGHGFCFYFL